MAEIFISYKREDRSKAKLVAESLIEKGYSVWWDVNLLPGEGFAKEIEAIIKQARVAIVLWSEAATSSRWVLAEAELARKLGILLPYKLEDIDPPFGFGDLHFSDLKDWSGENPEAPLLRILSDVENRIGPPREHADDGGVAGIDEYTMEASFWAAVSGAEPQSATEYEVYLRRFGENGHFVDLAKSRIERLGKRNISKIIEQFWKPIASALAVVAAVATVLNVWVDQQASSTDTGAAGSGLVEIIDPVPVAGETLGLEDVLPPKEGDPFSEAGDDHLDEEESSYAINRYADTRNSERVPVDLAQYPELIPQYMRSLSTRKDVKVEGEMVLVSYGSEIFRCKYTYDFDTSVKNVKNLRVLTKQQDCKGLNADNSFTRSAYFPVLKVGALNAYRYQNDPDDVFYAPLAAVANSSSEAEIALLKNSEVRFVVDKDRQAISQTEIISREPIQQKGMGSDTLFDLYSLFEYGANKQSWGYAAELKSSRMILESVEPASMKGAIKLIMNEVIVVD